MVAVVREMLVGFCWISPECLIMARLANPPNLVPHRQTGFDPGSNLNLRSPNSYFIPSLSRRLSLDFIRNDIFKTLVSSLIIRHKRYDRTAVTVF